MDVDKWKKHFKDMVAGKTRQNGRSKYVVSSNQTGGKSDDPPVKFVTPVAQAVELAKSELKEDESYKGGPIKRSSSLRGTIRKKRPRVSDALS